MGVTRHTVLPVVSRANVRRLLGVVTLPDVLRAYGVERLVDVPSSERSAVPARAAEVRGA
jgi:CBS domain-containing protein